jgi:hypothetical protein
VNKTSSFESVPRNSLSILDGIMDVCLDQVVSYSWILVPAYGSQASLDIARCALREGTLVREVVHTLCAAMQNKTGQSGAHSLSCRTRNVYAEVQLEPLLARLPPALVVAAHGKGQGDAKHP